MEGVQDVVRTLDVPLQDHVQLLQSLLGQLLLLSQEPVGHMSLSIWSPWIAINYLNKFFWPEFSMSPAVQLAEAECLLVYQNNRPASYN